MADVAVLIYAYNAELTLAGAVTNALNQAQVSTEVVIIDDHSSDDTPAIAAQLSAADPERIRVITHVERLHELEAWRSGVRTSRAPWILCMDAAEQLKDGSVGALVAQATATRSDIACGSYELIARKTRPDLVAKAADTGSIMSTGILPVLVSPPAVTLTDRDIANALFIDHTVSWELTGKLLAAPLARHTFAEIEPETVGLGENACVMFVMATLAERMVCVPGVTVTTAHDAERTAEAVGIKEFARLVHTRRAAEVALDYLNNHELWESWHREWEGLALTLASESLARFPQGLEGFDWPQGAKLLMEEWGASYIAGALDANPALDTAAIVPALSTDPSMAIPSQKPSKIALVARLGDPLNTLIALYDQMAGHGADIMVVIEEGYELEGTLSAKATIPKADALVMRVRSLNELLGELEADAVVTMDTEGAAWDLLVARTRRMATGLYCLNEAEDAQSFLALVPAVSLATAVVGATSGAGTLWHSLGSRTATMENLPASLTLGSASTPDTAQRELMYKLVLVAEDFAAHVKALKDQTREALRDKEAMAAEMTNLQIQVGKLSREVAELTGERDALKAEVEELSRSGLNLFGRGFRNRGAKPSES